LHRPIANLILESLHACEKPNYFFDFGFKYCQIFENLNDRFSPKGQAALPFIRSCLITQIVNEPTLTCKTAKSLALQHHIDCYLQSSFCELSVADKWKVYRVVRKELQDPEFHATMKKIAKACNSFNLR
jgi:hypothetical protein